MKYRTLIRDVIRMMCHSASRLGVASVAIVFMTMGGAPGMGHSTHVGHHATSAQASTTHDAAGPHAGHHVAPTEEGDEDSPTTECTCVGPCQSGTAPSDTRTAMYAVGVGEVYPVRLVAYKVRLLDLGPRSHLLPFPNPPPSRV